ncbi:MAG TPA: sec-independent translocase [Actinocrinis sp.]|jgi:sec-independent protein translocase protein TatB
MFFDLSPLEIIVLLGMAVVLFGPDKLPQAAASAARFLRQVRAFSESARSDLRKELGPEFGDIGLEDLNPKNFVRKNLLGESEMLRGLRDDLNSDLRDSLSVNGANGEVPSPRRSTPPTLPAGERPPFDEDAT